MTQKQEKQFNKMLRALRRIIRECQPPNQLRSSSKKIQELAKSGARNIRPIKIEEE